MGLQANGIGDFASSRVCSAQLSQGLPQAVDRLTPDGPDGGLGGLGDLLSMLTKR